MLSMASFPPDQQEMGGGLSITSANGESARYTVLPLTLRVE